MAATAWSRNVVRCARCGHESTAEEWRARPSVRTLTSAELVGHVKPWPADAVVEVRACAGCGGSMARSARAAR